MKRIRLTVLILLYCMVLNSQNEDKIETVIQLGHSSTISDLSFSSDNKFVATSSWDNTLKLWDVTTGAEMRTFYGHADWVNCIDFSPDGKRIATGSSDGSVRIWNIENGKQIEEYYVSGNKEKYNPVEYVYYLNETELLILSEQIICVFDTKSGKIKKIIESDLRYSCTAITKDQKYLVIGGAKDHEMIELWNLNENKKINVFHNEKYGHSPQNAAISPDGKYIVFDGLTKIFWYHTKTNKVVKEIEEYKYDYSDNTDKTSGMFFSNDGKLLFVQKGGPFIEVYDTKNYELIRKIKGGKMFGISSDGKYLMTKESPQGRWANKSDERMVLIEVKTGLRIKKFGNTIFPLYSANLAKTKNMVITSSVYTSSKLWDVTNADIKNVIERKAEYADIDNSGNYIILSDEYTADLLDAKKNDTITSINALSYMIGDVKVSPLGNYIASTDHAVFSVPEGKLLFNFNQSVRDICFSPDEKMMIVIFDNMLKRYHVPDFTAIDSVIFKDEYPYASALSSDKEMIAVTIEKIEPAEQLIFIYNKDLKKIGTLKGHKSSIRDMDFSPDNKLLISVSGGFTDVVNNTVRIWNLDEMKQETVLKEHKREITAIAFTHDGKRFITGSMDGSLIIWDTETKQPIVTFCAIGDGYDYVAITPDNYYYCSKNARNSIYFVKGLDVYTFDNFDLKYNRPDIVLERIGYADKNLIRSFRKAYQKRLQKTGFNEKMLNEDWHLPEIEIINSDDIQFKSKNPEIKFDIKASDSKYRLNKIIVNINDVPVFGTQGIDLSKQNISEVNESIKLTLSEGVNKIQISVLNEKAAESLKQTTYINYIPEKKVKHDLYIISIGVSVYENKEINLAYASKDAEDILSLFESNSQNYDQIISIPIYNEEATKENIKKVKEKLMKSNVDDQVIIFYAGHGMLDQHFDYYLATTDTNIDDISENALPYDDFEGLTNGIPARKKLILIDACHSGEVDKETDFTESGKPVKEVSGVVKFNDQTRNVMSSKGSDLGLQNSFELMKILFTDLRKSTGANIISSAGGGEFAIEGEMMQNGTIVKIDNGIFTFSVIEGLSLNKADTDTDNIITVSELRNYVLNRVSQLSAGYQNPTSRKENHEFDFEIW